MAQDYHKGAIEEAGRKAGERIAQRQEKLNDETSEEGTNAEDTGDDKAAANCLALLGSDG
jgi:hypothetical protein